MKRTPVCRILRMTHVALLCLCLALPAWAWAAGPPEPDVRGKKAIFAGNVRTGKYHKRGCRYFNCKNCVAVFASRQEAEDQGYIACKLCKD